MQIDSKLIQIDSEMIWNQFQIDSKIHSKSIQNSF